MQTDGSPLQALIKTLGLTIWGFIAFGLLILFGVVGYELAIKYQGLNGGLKSADVSVQSTASPNFPHAPAQTSASSSTASDLQISKTMPSAASDQLQRQTATEVARQRYASGQATPEDLSVLSLSYFASNDCPNALLWPKP